MWRGCRSYLFGVRASDGQGEAARVVHVKYVGYSFQKAQVKRKVPCYSPADGKDTMSDPEALLGQAIAAAPVRGQP